ncbi:MAG: efflux RND transporter permease subunit [Oscillibacter sp.]|nr:efflux RND transporter permease subunit [Oscillibacter sp.]
MSVAKFCINHRVTTILAVIMLTIFGVMFTTRLQMSLLPDMETPMAAVMCYYNGANPTDMEELVTKPLESAALRVSGVKEVSSTSGDGSSTVIVRYVDGTDLDIAATRLREQFDMISLPEDATKPVILNMDIGALMPTAVVALMGDDLNQLQTLSEDVVTPALERIDGIASVTAYGGTEQEISVRLDSARAEGYGLSNNYLAQILSAENLLYPGGDVSNGKKKLTVSTDAKYKSADDVRNTLVPLPTGGAVRLGEVAAVELADKDRDTLAKMGGKECVILMVSKQSGANEARASQRVEERLAELAAENPGMRYYMAYSAVEYINQAVSSALQNIALGVGLAAVIVFLFLRRFGPTLTIAVSMPVCILTVFVLMNAFDLTMNMMSLGGIAMGVGMIVDNSIVVLENIYRFASDGHDKMTACVDGTAEVTGSVVASTLTTVAVFLPLGLTGGTAGMMFKDFCLTIAFLILSSLVIALTWVPLLCYLMLDAAKARRGKLDVSKRPGVFGNLTAALYNAYMKVLSHFTYHPGQGMIVCAALVAVFVMSCANTNMVLIPEMDQGEVNVSVSLPIGSSTEEATEIAEQVMAAIEGELREGEMENAYYMVSGGAGMSSMMSSGDITVGLNLVKKAERERSASQIADALREPLNNIAGCEITVSASQQMSMGSSDDISVELSGEDYGTLSLLADELAQKIAALPDAVDVKSSVSERAPQVEITMNRDNASRYGLTAAQVGAAVRAQLTGATATKVTMNNTELDVVIKGDGAAAQSLDALRSMPVATALGGSVALSAVANVNVVQAPQSIARSNQSRQVSVTGDTLSGNSAAITQEINAILETFDLPQGYGAETAGSYEDMMESFGDLLLALAVALGLVYFVLAAQFESFLMPVIVMLILPVAFSGALFALPLTGRDISMISLVSLIMLAGTVVNSSIILVDYINVRRREGEEREDAILHACPLRVRPVLMTTLTTVLAMVPMAIGVGDTNEMMTDMGVTMMSGMIISTVITLFFTPVFYIVIDNIPRFFLRKRRPYAEAL